MVGVSDEDLAERLEDLIDWSLKDTVDGASCRICERLHAPTCPIVKAYDLLGLKPRYLCAGCGIVMDEPFQQVWSIFLCEKCPAKRGD